MYNKKKILLISLGTCLVLFITAISFTYYHKNNIKKLDDFASYLENYKLDLTNYSLIDNQENYNNLITKSEQTISNKDYKNINSLKSELDKLKENILNKNNDIIVNFSNYLDSYKNEFSTFNLNDNQESYNNLILESEKTISDKNYKSLDSLITKLKKFKENILSKNIQDLNSNISELESIDVSKISNKDFIINKLEEIKKLRDEKQFIKAIELLKTLKEDIDIKLKSIEQEEHEKLTQQQYDDIQLLTPIEVINLTTEQLGKDNQGKTWEFTQYIRIMKHIETKEIYYILYINFNDNRYHYLINARTKYPDNISLKYKYNYSENDFQAIPWPADPSVNTN